VIGVELQGHGHTAAPAAPCRCSALARPSTSASWRGCWRSEPAIRRQTLRDLAGAPAGEWRRGQRRVATEGWGARLLAHRDSARRWTPRLYGKKWLSTTYSMVLLRQLGLPQDDEQARQSCLLFLDDGL
jgi:hypothetical protein